MFFVFPGRPCPSRQFLVLNEWRVVAGEDAGTQGSAHASMFVCFCTNRKLYSCANSCAIGSICHTCWLRIGSLCLEQYRLLQDHDQGTKTQFCHPQTRHLSNRHTEGKLRPEMSLYLNCIGALPPQLLSICTCCWRSVWKHCMNQRQHQQPGILLVRSCNICWWSFFASTSSSFFAFRSCCSFFLSSSSVSEEMQERVFPAYVVKDNLRSIETVLEMIELGSDSQEPYSVRLKYVFEFISTTQLIVGCCSFV